MNIRLRVVLLVLLAPIWIPVCVAGWLGYVLASAIQGEWL